MTCIFSNGHFDSVSQNSCPEREDERFHTTKHVSRNSAVLLTLEVSPNQNQRLLGILEN